MENKPASSLVVSLGEALNGTPHLYVEAGDPEIATSKRVRTYRPNHSDTSLSREWRMNMAPTALRRPDRSKQCHCLQFASASLASCITLFKHLFVTWSVLILTRITVRRDSPTARIRL